MASNSKETVSWGFRLAAIVVTLAVLAGVFAFAFSRKSEGISMIFAGIPFVSGLVVSYAFGSIGKLSHKRWQIYLTVLLLVAAVVCLRIAGVL